jgi:hypothetical protein
MPLEISYHMSCDRCHNYCGYMPVYTRLEAIGNAQKLGWYVHEAPASSYTTELKVYAICPNCKQDVGEYRVGERGDA